MFSSSALKIPKKLHQVVLRIHPEGRVVGILFLHHQTKYSSQGEDPLEVMNQSEPFVVLRREAPDELRFYNKSSIIHVEYDEEPVAEFSDISPLYCRLHLMDGSLIEGCIRLHLPPNHARLSDYLNVSDERFAKIHTDSGKLWLVNKSYIVYVTPLDGYNPPSIYQLGEDA